MEPGAIRRTNADHETGDPLSSETTVDYDPFSASTLADPMRAYNELRERCPVHQFTDFSPPFATITRYDDVVAVLKTPTSGAAGTARRRSSRGAGV